MLWVCKVLVLATVLCTVMCQHVPGGACQGSGAWSKAVVDSSCSLSKDDLSSNCSSNLWKHWKNGTCQCGSDLHRIVLCEMAERSVGVLQCYCMYNLSHNGPGMVVGSCLYGCFINATYLNLYENYTTSENLTSMCDSFHRIGPFCGRCNSSHGVQAYSFSLKCIPCEFKWSNVAKYIFFAYAPLTMFLILIVVFTVSVNSAPLHGYIFVAQMLATSISMRILDTMKVYKPNQLSTFRSIDFGATVYGFWNLDFFRFVNHRFCLHPSMSTLQVMSLDYLIALYPFVIIVLTYVLVELHDCGCKVVTTMWRPFHYCFARFRHQLNIRTSLVDAFGTFFSLSYVKILSTTVDLMMSAPVWDINGTRAHFRLYYDSTLIFFSEEHFPFALASLLMFSIFNILPVIFLLVYPRRIFQRRMPANMRRILHPFMDSLLGAYKDGTGGSWDCRFFAVVYLLARVAVFGCHMITLNSFSFVLATIIVTLTGMLVAVIKPYKSAVYNTVDTILVLCLALSFAGLGCFFFAGALSQRQWGLSRVIMILPIAIPFLYVCGLVLYNTCVLDKLPQRLLCVLWRTLGQRVIRLVGRLRKRHEMTRFPAANERTPLIGACAASNCDR